MPTISVNRQWRLSDEQYFKSETDKSQIVLHHTVGGSARSTFEYWQENPDRIATAYIVDRDGTIYEVFDPLYWAHHLGMKVPKNVLYNQRSIGIELASEGSLRNGYELNQLRGTKTFDEEYLYAFDIDPAYDQYGHALPKDQWFKHAKKLYNIVDDKDKFFVWGVPWRDYIYFDAYDEPQVASTIALVKHLCEQFDIPKFSSSTLDFDLGWATFKGIITHANVRKDKSDLSPAWDWDRLNAELT